MNYGYYDSPLGLIMVTSNRSKIIAVSFTNDCGLYSTLSPEIVKCCQQLDAYFKQKSKIFTLEYQIFKANFTNNVLNAVCKIPYGQTKTYQEIAIEIGTPLAVRAVGTALANNPIAIIIPCHRVVNKNKKKSSYLYGVEIKNALLHIESIN